MQGRANLLSSCPMRSYEEINRKIEAKKAVVLTAEEWGYPVSVDRSGLVAWVTPKYLASYLMGEW